MVSAEPVAEGGATMKTHFGKPREIKPSLREFEALVANEEKVNA